MHIRENFSLNNFNGYIGTNIKGRVVQMMGNLHFEYASDKLYDVIYESPLRLSQILFPL